MTCLYVDYIFLRSSENLIWRSCK